MRDLSRVLALLLALLVSAAAHGAELAVHFLDVGQGDSALIVSPSGKTVLVDAGPPEAAAALARRVRALVTGPIDLMVLTHAHADHLGGFEAVLGAVGARTFMDAGGDTASPPYMHLLRALERGKVPVKNAEAGRTIDIGGGAALKVLAPTRPFIVGSRSDVNANSVVVRLTYGGTAFYLSGDSEHETERRILASGETMRADVYKVAHHGGRHSNSPELMARMAPTIAVISAGANNEYGHPHQEVLDRLARRGVRVFRTDQDGEVVVRSDGARVDAQALGASGARMETPHAGAGESHGAAPVSAAMDTRFVASRHSAVFHRADCAGAASIAARNRMTFASRAAAVASGRRPAKDCAP